MFRTWIALAALLLLCVSCRSAESVDMASVDPRGWSEAVRVEVENSDTLSLRKISVVIRYNSSFKGSELPLLIAVQSPDSCLFEERVTLPTQGLATAKIVSEVASLPYREEVLLARSGDYIFTFTPVEEMCGVEAIGVEIKR